MNTSDLQYTIDPRRALQETVPAPPSQRNNNAAATVAPTPVSRQQHPTAVPAVQAPGALHQPHGMPPTLNLSGIMHSDTGQQLNFSSIYGNDLSTMPQLQQQLNQSIAMQQQQQQQQQAPTNIMSQQLLQQHLQQMPTAPQQQHQPQHQPQQQLSQQQQPQQQQPQQAPLQQQPQQQQQQQIQQQVQVVQSHPPQPQQLQPHQPNNDYLRSLMNQKINFPSNIFDDHMRQRFMTAPAEPLLQPQLMNDPRFLMGPGGGIAGLHSSLTQRSFALPSPHELTLRDENRRMRGGVIEPFPEKLHRLLTEVEASGRGDVISFIANGKAFAIHKPDKFFKEIVPKYFRQSRLSSFKRQLNLYGFELINTGPARGGYYHEMFTKERPELCRRMRRIAIKLQNNKPNDDEQQKQKNPDFFDMQQQQGETKTGGGGEQQQPQPPIGSSEESLQNTFRANAAA